jgi:hypothetical protein
LCYSTTSGLDALNLATTISEVDSMIYLYREVDRLETPFLEKRADGWPSLFFNFSIFI